MDAPASNDVRKEQVVLLRFEKELARLAAIVAAMSTTAAAASEKVDAEAATGAYERIRQALVGLADVTTAAHVQLEAIAVSAGLQFFQASGGTPKHEPPAAEVVRSVLGIG